MRNILSVPECIAIWIWTRTQRIPSEALPQLATMPECWFKIRDQQNAKKQWNSEWRAIYHTTCCIDTWRRVICYWSVCDVPDRARPLRWTYPTRLEYCFTDAQCSSLIFKCVRLRIVDTLLTLTFITLRQHLYTEKLYATNHIHIMHIQYCVCIDSRLHPGFLLPLNFSSNAIYTIWVTNDVALSPSCAFGRQLTACWSFH
jgi:hypothetical protein